jgi:hypothetical protein
MVYSEWYNSPPGGQGNCIGWATAPALGTVFTALTTAPYCSGDETHSFLDPSIFTTASGTPYLLFSEEWGATGSLTTGSTLWIAPLAANGLSVSGTPEPLLTIKQAAKIPNYCSCTAGSSPRLENPSMTRDDYNGYDLTFSLGTWTDHTNTDYITGEVACPKIYPTPDCNSYTSQGAQLMELGSASTVTDLQPSENWMVYDQWAQNAEGNWVRYDRIGATSEINCNSGC